jgi:ABC-type multidrug transport system permease subunit
LKKNRIKMLSKVACYIAVLVGFVLLGFAAYFQQRVAKNNEFFSKLRDNPHMKGWGTFYHQMVSFNASMRTTIPLLTTIGIILCVVGGFLLFLPRKMILAFLLLTVILFSNLPSF